VHGSPTGFVGVVPHSPVLTLHVSTLPHDQPCPQSGRHALTADEQT